MSADRNDPRRFLAPSAPWIVEALGQNAALPVVPHYIDGTMLLGDVTQAAAAFVAVQGAFNWLIDNFPRLAEFEGRIRHVGFGDRLDHSP
jgi:ABC-type uncharacterized transport system fused permease/ATPase subunit